jgi:hypothetical protein
VSLSVKAILIPFILWAVMKFTGLEALERVFSMIGAILISNTNDNSKMSILFCVLQIRQCREQCSQQAASDHSKMEAATTAEADHRPSAGLLIIAGDAEVRSLFHHLPPTAFLILPIPPKIDLLHRCVNLADSPDEPIRFLV